ncbi:methionine gamma-lyase [Bacillus coahuilensis p1.1.43]|uniref:L-methionine gamma-lyase n=1 Tax=Bacillus coahuilensis p1.1.43 TaxID=1150625 RepID=A0A147K6C0_9BACI|nr:methionine gamma-lyase [Bacillus coahuilensis]KUP05430.1 methionine gamma-lyase [Bacillus coahuilensis p1.1.43]
MNNGDVQFETSVIHHGYSSRKHHDSLTPPIYPSSTFAFANAKQGEERFSGEQEGYIYSRLSNPTVKILEERMAELEKGDQALAFSSGMAAVSAVLLALTKSGDHILCSKGVYGCTFGLLQFMQEKYAIGHDFSNLDTEEEIRKRILPTTTCIYVETPINPTMQVIDLTLLSGIAKEYSIPVVVDNTFSSPYLQQPLALGCDLVIHSATKYIGGHGDVVAGIAVGKKDIMTTIQKTTQKDIGGILSPFDAWLLLRGLKTLAIRMDRHTENAAKVFSFLKQHELIDKIYYPGDPDHPDYRIAKQQMKKPGGLLSFTIRGGKEMAQKLMDSLQLIQIAVSLGDAETLIQHPATMTHAVVPEENRLIMGITDGLLRLSVGLEHADDLCRDLEQALSKTLAASKMV